MTPDENTIWLRAKDAEVLSYLQGFGRGDVYVKKEWIMQDLKMSDCSVRQCLHHLRHVGAITGYFDYYQILRTCEDPNVFIPQTRLPKKITVGKVFA